jgi:high-affinity K+ transport system ATPase subunit B
MPGVEEEAFVHALGRYVSALPDRNGTAEALHAAFGGDEEDPVETIPFSSSRRWSGLRLGDVRYVLGAPELFALGATDARVRAHQGQGRRAVALGVTSAPFPSDPSVAPPLSRPLGVVVLAEALRDDAAETVAFLAAEGVDVKVLSGDDPATVLSIARDVGLAADGIALDGRELPEDDDSLGDIAWTAGVIGRIDPEGKRRVVEALIRDGRYVAMVGDGVNDVPALKAARLAIAPTSFSSTATSLLFPAWWRKDGAFSGTFSASQSSSSPSPCSLPSSFSRSGLLRRSTRCCPGTSR